MMHQLMFTLIDVQSFRAERASLQIREQHVAVYLSREGDSSNRGDCTQVPAEH